MKKIGNILFSMTTAVVLMTVFAIAIAWATFIENDYGTEMAKYMVYGSTWFEILLFAIAVNISGNVVKYKLVTRKKWTILLFHLAFLFILLGGAVTRYFGYEGMMHIREGSTSDEIQLSKTYLMLEAEYKDLKKEVSKKIRLTPTGKNRYNTSLEIGGRDVEISTELYLSNAEKQIVPSENGVPAVSLFIMNRQKSGYEYDLMQGEQVAVEDLVYGLGSQGAKTVSFLYNDEVPSFIATDTVLLTNMMTRDTVVLMPEVLHAAQEKAIYRIKGQVFVIKSFLPSASTSLVNNLEKATGKQGLIATLSSGDEFARVSMLNEGGVGVPSIVELGDIKLHASFGSKVVKTPFYLELKKFVLDRYPGSNSPSSYASEVVLHDPENDLVQPYRIYMNHTLKYAGYRFFQSSYDRDERGTVLSVSHDFWGTWISYFGYFLMGLGMVLSLINKNSRFRLLFRQSAKLKAKKKATLLIFFSLALASGSYAQSTMPKSMAVSKSSHIKELNTLLVQNNSGRIEPFATLTSEVMRKIYRKEKFNGLSATEVVLGMLYNPQHWQQVPIIKISNSKLAEDLGVATGYTSYAQMFVNGKYKLKDLVDATYHKEPNKRNKYDKEIINLDERINISYQIYNGSFIKLFPVPGDEKSPWNTPVSFSLKSLPENTVNPVNLYSVYLNEAALAQSTGNWSKAQDRLLSIKSYQMTIGGNVIPNLSKIRLEVFYSRANIFGKLSKLYMLVGVILLFIHLLTIFKPSINIKGISIVGLSLAILVFLAYTAGIAIRWIISEHAPWSNGYETMVFIGWATALAGLFFARQSGVTLAVTNLLAGIILMVAGFSWMNPEITPLVPVLKSYWLIVHVAIITSSYGFLGIGALLALLNLLLIVFRTNTNIQRLSFQIKELSIIIEITLIIGLILLTVGSFLGGIWANESWGRYWGWDPKETWALVTILVYAVVLHINKIPSFKGVALFNGLALISFSSVLMTFFGVNYYLSGLHSYAQGDAPPIPNAVYFSAVFIITIIIAAVLSERRKPLEVEDIT